MLRAPSAAPDAVYVLVALGRVFGEVDACMRAKKRDKLVFDGNLRILE